MTDLENAARVAMQITRAAPLFDQLVDMLLSHAVPAIDASHPGDSAARQAGLRSIRERLDAYYPEYQRLYFELLREQLGARLPEVLDALSHDLVQQFLKAQRAMEHALISELERLAEKMVTIIPIAESQPDHAKAGPQTTRWHEPSGASPSESDTPDDLTLPWHESAVTSLDATLPIR